MMNLSISNIAWEAEKDEMIYCHLRKLGFSAIEIAPTRWFPDAPYDRLTEAVELVRSLKEKWGLGVSSMQSIWYGRSERLFGSIGERTALLKYTKQAMDFAQAIGCGNLVFGCPRNRSIPEDMPPDIAIDFFRACGQYADSHDTCFSLEANPSIYNTNFINTTRQAFSVVREVGCPGVRVNVDMGTMIYYDEPVSLIGRNLDMVNHIHISEPNLIAPVHTGLIKEMLEMLSSSGYAGSVSIEMGKNCGLDAVLRTTEMVAGLAQQ